MNTVDGLFQRTRIRRIPGYFVRYPEGYVSWSPKHIFEQAYMEVNDNKDLPSGISIGQKMVDEFVAYTETITMGGPDHGGPVCAPERNLRSWNQAHAWIRGTIPRSWDRKSVWRRSRTGYGSFWDSSCRLHGME